MKKMMEAARKATPQWSNDRGLTSRDGTTVGLITLLQVVVYWVAHDVLGLEMPPEVAGAISGLITFWIARKTRY